MEASIISSIIIGAVASGVTVYFGVHSTKMAKDRMEKELFKDFNERYDKLNEYLRRAEDFASKKDLMAVELEYENKGQPRISDKVIDYFNLCAEEYYWFRKGRISPEIWKSWQKGMGKLFKSPAIFEMWEDEIKEEGYISYYLKSDEKFWEVEKK